MYPHTLNILGYIGSPIHLPLLPPLPHTHPCIRTGEQVESLRNIVARKLGYVLDKSQQMSDWERRPLNAEQVLFVCLCVCR